MSGHCEFHNFERAADVCSVCFGDICESCVVMLPGRRYAVCTECAIQISGVRKSARPVVRGDKSTVTARRKRYAADPGDDKFFQFFTSGTESQSGATSEDTGAEPVPERRRGRFRFGRGRSSDSDDKVDVGAAISSDGEGDQSPDPVGTGAGDLEPGPSGAVTRLNRLRRSLHHGETEHGDSDLADGTATDLERVADEQPEIPESRPDRAPALPTAEPMPAPSQEPADDPPSLRSLASQVAASGPSPIDQLLDPAVLDPTTGPDERDEPARFEPADLSVDPFDIGATPSFEAAVSRHCPEANHRPPKPDNRPEPDPRPTGVDHQHPQPDHRPPKPGDQHDADPRPGETDTDGRWIPPALRGVGPAAPEG